MKSSLALALFLGLPALTLGQTPPGSPPAITGISHLVFYADDLQKSQQFYALLVGWLPVTVTGTEPGVRFYVNHAQYIQLVSAPRPGMANRLDRVAFSTDDAEALRGFLGAHGVDVPGAVTVGTDGSRSFLTRDPEGNKVEFTQEGEQPPSVPASVSQRLSPHIVHAGYVVRDRAALDHFYRDLLGFHLYWQGGFRAGDVDWVMMQVPNGSDWIEYMLYLPAEPSRAQLGSANHFSPGVVSVAELQKRLETRGWKRPSDRNAQILGVDGKLQLDLVDPDGTRVEFMELKPLVDPCCSPYTGTQPSPSEGW